MIDHLWPRQGSNEAHEGLGGKGSIDEDFHLWMKPIKCHGYFGGDNQVYKMINVPLLGSKSDFACNSKTRGNKWNVEGVLKTPPINTLVMNNIKHEKIIECNSSHVNVCA